MAISASQIAAAMNTRQLIKKAATSAAILMVSKSITS
jgi:hypothetical protein